MKHFQKGSGKFNCACCGRATRHTGVQSEGSEACPDCYELAGFFNSLQDGEDVTQYAMDIVRYCEHIVDNGGKLDGDALALLAACKEAVPVASTAKRRKVRKPRDEASGELQA